MKFFKQVNIEINNILESKFILIILALILAYCIVPSVIGAVFPNFNQDNDIYSKPLIDGRVDYFYTDIYYENYESSQPITVNGITVDPENPLYWHIKYSMEEQLLVQTDIEVFDNPSSKNMVLDIYDIQIAFYLNAAKNISTQNDYRYELVWSFSDYPIEKYIYEHNIEDAEALKTAAEYKWIFEEDFYGKFINITPEQRSAEIAETDKKLDVFNEILENSDESSFKKYIEIKINIEKNNIASLQKQIAILEQSKLDDPVQDESINIVIDIIKRDIEMIAADTIPILEYRLDKHIVPYTDCWQNKAMYDIAENQMLISHIELVTKQEFNLDQELTAKYKTYENYVADQDDQINQYNSNILVAKNSLNAGKPDMKYVWSGARQQTVNFLNYSIIVAMFAILLGGWIIASEYQQGTIRPLMIIPKRRIKTLMSKFIAALTTCLLLYAAGAILNLIANGICFGFDDFTFPNYTASGQINFFVEYIPAFLACAAPVIFAFCIAFMLSVIIKNTAVAVIIPAVCYVACFIVMDTANISVHPRLAEVLMFTPVPYADISAFFMQNSTVHYIIENFGVPLNVPAGVIMLLVLAGICTLISVLTFNKQDIIN